ncbi:MAG TPA: transcription termination/antitermination protein NusG [Acidobacteriota bacterium]|nr:transcription termination/antitermination protein NusG [Acidobacteriota bacterium]
MTETEQQTAKRWYVVHTYSGFEKKVKESLEQRISAMGYEDRIEEIMIPTEDVVERRGNKRVVTDKKLFPGYLLIKMEMDDHLWHFVRSTPKVTGFVGSGKNPTPLSESELDQILNRMEETAEKPAPATIYEPGDVVRIIDGPFTNFQGRVEDVNIERSTLRVLVTIFGRATPVELEFLQVEKA